MLVNPKPLPYKVPPVIVVADIELDVVFPVTVKLPLTVNPVTVLKKVLNVPPVLFVYVNVLFEYVPPVTLISVGKLR